MAGKFVVNGDQTTVTFTYTALTQKVLDTVNDAVGYLYPAIFGEVLDGEGVLIPFDELTNAQKLNVLDAWLLKGILDLAKEHNRNAAIDTARETANTEADTKYI